MRGFDVVFKNVDKIVDAMKKATMQVALETAIDMEAYAKENKPWTDRNRHASSHLRGAAFEKDGVIHCQIRQDLYGDTGEEYGYHLEESHGKKYAILVPTQQYFEQDFFDDVHEACMQELAKDIR